MTSAPHGRPAANQPPLLLGRRKSPRRRRATGQGRLCDLVDIAVYLTRDDERECDEVAEVRRHSRVGFDPDSGRF